MNGCRQVFILGAPRSGTTYLASLLSQTRFGEPVESHFILKYLDQLPRYGELNKRKNFGKLLRAILSERAVMQWKIDVDPDQLFDSFGGRVSYAGLVDNLFRLRRNTEMHLAWGDKTPWYLMHPEKLLALFPQAKFIYIVRDGRDVGLSLLQQKWGPNNIYACAKYWKRLNRQHACFAKLRKDKQLLELKYETLISSRDNTLEQIYRFLEEPSLSQQDLKRLPQAISQNTCKWKTQLSSRQLRIFEGVAASTLERQGYELACTNPSVGKLETLGYRTHDKVMWSLFMLKTNIIDGLKIRFLGKEPFAD